MIVAAYIVGVVLAAGAVGVLTTAIVAYVRSIIADADAACEEKITRAIERYKLERRYFLNGGHL